MKFLSYFLFLYSTVVFSQKIADVRVEYKMFCDTDVPLIILNTLSVSNNIGIYQQKLSTTERWTEKPTSIEISPEKLKSNYEPYLKIDRTKQEILFFDAIGSNIFLVQDNYKELEWTITQDAKMIDNYSCIKATTHFRGRDWVAWFTPEIPLSFGPWKLHGLPGLILEANDTTNRYSYKAIKIEYLKNKIFDQDFNSLMATKNKKAIPIQKFMEDREEASANADRILASNTEITLEIKKEPRKGEELIYEWEEQ